MKTIKSKKEVVAELKAAKAEIARLEKLVEILKESRSEITQALLKINGL